MLALATPVAKRVQKSMKALVASPDRNTKNPKRSPEMPTNGTRRRTRSHSQPIGTAPSTKNAADAVLMKTIAPSLIPKVAWISGASTLMAAPSSSSRELRSVRTTNMEMPPRRRPSRSDISSAPTPGSSSSGKTTRSLVRARSA